MRAINDRQAVGRFPIAETSHGPEVYKPLGSLRCPKTLVRGVAVGRGAELGRDGGKVGAP